ncbi:MAG: M23/M56 family metallopeptidase [Ruthenibacterium sp.]
MLNKLFGIVLTLTPWVSVILVILLLLRHFCSKKISARFFRVAWLVLALRLVLLVNISLPQAPVQLTLPIQTVTAPQNTAEKTPKTQVVMTLSVPQTALPQEDITALAQILPIIWLGGAALFLAFKLGVYAVFMFRLHKTRRRVRNENLCNMAEMAFHRPIRLYTTPDIACPMLAGLFRPAVYLPQNVPESTLPYVLAHEASHYHSADIAYQFLMLAAHALHWFNPLVFAMTCAAQKDLELACDERVLQNKTLPYRKAYGTAVLDTLMHARRTNVLSTGFAGNAKTLKERFIEMFNMNCKQKGFGLLAFLLVLILSVSTLVACNAPKMESEPTSAASSGSTAKISDKDLQTVTNFCKKLLTQPDKGYLDAVDADMAKLDATMRSGERSKPQEDLVNIAGATSDSAVFKYLKTKYDDTLTDELLEKMIQEQMEFGSTAQAHGYESVPSSPEITMTSTGHYAVTVPVVANFTDGTAIWSQMKLNVQTDASGKISYARFQGGDMSFGTLQKEEKAMAQSIVPADSAAKQKESDIAWDTWAADCDNEPKTAADTFVWPLSGYTTLSTDFGSELVLFGSKSASRGISVPAPEGTPIVAAADGTVYTQKGWSYGNSVKILHGNGMVTLYGHMQSFDVTDGQSVKKGEQIGTVGSTGNSTGNHLFFELTENGTPKDPKTLFEKGNENAADVKGTQPPSVPAELPPQNTAPVPADVQKS